MGLLSFKGGIHPPHSKKYTEDKPTEIAVEPVMVHITSPTHWSTCNADCESRRLCKSRSKNW